MGNIVLLDDNTINKIAAGEVIERPGSAVKELLENSIDAGATTINVEIKNGGISYIRITDNGKGISPDDMELAFERHATSKIRKAEDLSTVTSMGFRGEALASIAAVSKIEMTSKTLENELGYKIEIEGGKLINKEETGCPKGTSITIRELFFNTPVRYKFLKKDFTEAGYIEDVVTRIALVHPEIAIKLVNNGKTIIQTPGNNDKKAVIYAIFGKDISDNILDVDYTYEDIRVTGVIGKPIIARSNRSNQIFFVNKRYIRDKILTSSAEQGYKGLITIGKYGFLVLNVEMDPQKVDVNVHPAKLEVRFEEENKVFKAIYHAIKDTLLKSDLVGDPDSLENKDAWKMQKNLDAVQASTTPVESLNYSKKLEEDNKKTGFGGLFSKFSKNKEEVNSIAETDETYKLPTTDGIRSKIDDTQVFNSENNDETKVVDLEAKKYDTKVIETAYENNETKEINEEDKKFETKVVDTVNKESSQIKEDMAKLENLKMESNTENFDEMYMRIFGSLPSNVRKVQEEEKRKEEEKEAKITLKPEEMKPAENISLFPQENKEKVPQYKFIGIAFSTYIILEMGNELYILDQHAAHERILYEKVKKNYYSETEKDSQLMLLPDIINLSHKEMDIAKENMDMFRKAGFTLEEFGENTIKLSGVPNICLDLETKELFMETLDEIDTVARTAKQEKEEKFIATVACKAAVKANMALTKEEVDKLMEQLLVLPNPFTCPHGRPTAIKMTKVDIERKFSRR